MINSNKRFNNKVIVILMSFAIMMLIQIKSTFKKRKLIKTN